MVYPLPGPPEPVKKTAKKIAKKAPSKKIAKKAPSKKKVTTKKKATTKKKVPTVIAIPAKVFFGVTNTVRYIDTDLNFETDMKTRDGPSRINVIYDALISSYFKYGEVSPNELKVLLGEMVSEIHENSAELSGRLHCLSERLELLEPEEAVGILPSNTRLKEEHCPGIKILALWMWIDIWSSVDDFKPPLPSTDRHGNQSRKYE
tara:strand:+ start:267 stop:878 length:612 start_codon:yes stop_codon:yes gene_type:complete